MFIEKNKKIRGFRRKMYNIYNIIENIKWPEKSLNKGYINYHIPGKYKFYSSNKLRLKHKRKIIFKFLNKYIELSKTKKEWMKNKPIYCMITYPNLWDSEIFLIEDSNYNNQFNKYIKNVVKNKISGRSSLIDYLDIELSEDLIEIGYKEKFNSTDEEIWLYSIN